MEEYTYSDEEGEYGAVDTTAGISEDDNTLRPVREWMRTCGNSSSLYSREDEDGDEDEDAVTIIKYKTKPETRGLELVDDLVDVDYFTMERELQACENEEEVLEVILWKKWDTFARYVGEALEIREHRVIFYLYLGALMDTEMRRVVEEQTANRGEFSLALNQSAIVDIIETIDEWYGDYFSATTGTTAGLSEGSRGGVSADITADDLMEEEESAIRELLTLLTIRTRLFFLAHCEKWLSDETRGSDIKELYDLMEYGEEGGCLVDVETPILKYDVDTFVKACDALYRSWQELPFSRGLLRYIELLKARFASLSAIIFNNFRTLNVEAYRTTIKGDDDDNSKVMVHVNKEFIIRCNDTLENVERSLISFQTLLSWLGRVVPTPYPYNIPVEAPPRVGDGDNGGGGGGGGGEDEGEDARMVGSSKELFVCFSEWVMDYTNSKHTSRDQFIMKNFRKKIIAELVRPGEFSQYRQKYPLGDPNATNIISKLRPKDMDRYRQHIIGSTIPEMIQSTSDAVGMVTGRNELSVACLEYFCNEIEHTRIAWSSWVVRSFDARPSLLCGKTCFPVIIQTVGGYSVWCPWYSYLVGHREEEEEEEYDSPTMRKRTMNSRKHNKLYSVLCFHEAVHLACVLMVRHYGEIFEAMERKHSASSTRTSANIAMEVSDMYFQAQCILVNVFGGACLQDDIFEKVIGSTGLWDDGPYVAKTFDPKVHIDAILTKRGTRGGSNNNNNNNNSNNISAFVIKRAQRAFEEAEEKRRKKHYERVRSIVVPPILEAKQLFAGMFGDDDDDEDIHERMEQDKERLLMGKGVIEGGIIHVKL